MNDRTYAEAVEEKREKRNRLLHEQVMGKPVFCSEELDYEFPSDRCPVCHATFSIAEGMKYDSQTLHPRGDVPAYTTSMDAAWLIVKEMNKLQDWSPNRNIAFLNALEKLIGSFLFSDIFYCDPNSDDQNLTPERICLAALIACGVEVEQ